MKFRFLFPIFCAVLATACCCTPDKPDDKDTNGPEKPDEPKTEVPGPGIYKFVIAPDLSGKASVSAAGKTAWEEGDEILVTGGYTPGSVTVRLKASDISSDGKTATVNLSEVPSSGYGPDQFYAAWPAGAVDTEDMFTNDCFNFNTTDAPLMCAWLSGDTFSFQHVCAAMSFKADGGWDGCVLAGSNWQMMSYDSWSVEISSSYQDFDHRRGNSGYFLRKDLSDGGAVLYFPFVMNLEHGFKLYMRKGDSYPKVYEATSGPRLTRGCILDLGDISSSLKDYNGPAPELPKMPVMGKTTRIDVKEVPELSGLCLTSDGSALWTVGDNGWLGQISFDGKVTKFWSKSADMEGITIHPETGDLYIANEPQSVYRIKAPGYEKPDSWEKVITVDDAKGYGNSGMEGISYYKDNILFVGTQTGANVWMYTTDGKLMVRRDGSIVEHKDGDRCVSLRKVYTGIKEVGGLCYDAVNDWLWVSDSETHRLFVFDVELTHLLASYNVPDIHNAESVCVDHKNSCVWVGLDDDSTCAIFRIDFTGLN